MQEHKTRSAKLPKVVGLNEEAIPIIKQPTNSIKSSLVGLLHSLGLIPMRE